MGQHTLSPDDPKIGVQFEGYHVHPYRDADTVLGSWIVQFEGHRARRHCPTATSTQMLFSGHGAHADTALQLHPHRRCSQVMESTV